MRLHAASYLWIGLVSLVLMASCQTADSGMAPVNPNATPEAKALLKYIYSIKGKHTLSGQHNVPEHMSLYTDSIQMLTGKLPAIWGGDFGFSDERHNSDNIKYRDSLVSEIKKQHARGAIITLCYHQANPIEGEPCLFNPGVIYDLTDAQWADLLTPGTPVYESWKKQMDLIATYLLELKAANIPVLFRPYHEMNGGWFWWGARPGEKGYVALWKQLYKYYTEQHHLDNLLWVWSCDRPWPGIDKYYPGHDYVDILGADIYPLRDTNVVFRQEWYQRMDSLAGQKPFAITEQGVLPTMAELESQPNYAWFMSWNNMVLQYNDHDWVKELYNSEKVVSLDELPVNIK